MAKKKLLLNESATRRFMKLATIEPTYVSNFLNETEETEQIEESEVIEEETISEEEEDMGDMPMMADEPEMDPEMETEDEMEADEEPEKGPAAAEDMVMSLLAKIQEFAEENGVSMKLDGDEDDEEDDEMDEMDADMDEVAPEGGDAPDEAADMDDADMEGEGNYGKMMEETAEETTLDEEAIIAEVTRRVAKRLLKASK